MNSCSPACLPLALCAATLASQTPLAAQPPDGASVSLPEVVVEKRHGGGGGSAPSPVSLLEAPAGQVQTAIGPDRSADTRAASVADLLVDSPGVSLKQGTGPRDFGISIRGSNARNAFGTRNILLFDDGFPLTQPDGLSRSDLIDPHAFVGASVIRGPSSALYGNYATGGVVEFRTGDRAPPDGAAIVGADAGSYGYVNDYILYGKKVGAFATTVFASSVEGDSRTSHSAYNTQTLDASLAYAATPADRLTVKLIVNRVHADVSSPLSLNQYFANPYQRGCATPAGYGCQAINLFRNGFGGATVPQTADQAGFGRFDERAILGIRYERDVAAATTWRTQVTLDERHIDEPQARATAARGSAPSIDAISDVAGSGIFLGLSTTGYAAVFAKAIWADTDYFNVAPGGNATLGGLNQAVPTSQVGFGARLRGEIRLDERWSLVAGVGAERTLLDGRSTAFTYSGPNVVASISDVRAHRSFLDTAPEASLTWRPRDDIRASGRVATGYGTPQTSNLFVGADGRPGNNTNLKEQTNVGLDLSLSYSPAPWMTVEIDGFQEFFCNEIVIQSPGPGLMSTFFNAPRSQHRGVEVGSTLKPSSGWSLKSAFTYQRQVYTRYVERLSAGPTTSLFDRSGNAIPGIPPTELLLRAGYDVPAGDLRGLGAYVEYVRQGAFFVDNANLLKAPGYGLVNANVHYSRDVDALGFRSASIFLEARNIAGRTYVASATNVTDTIGAKARQNGADTVAATSGSIYAGTPRIIAAGLRLRF